MHFSRYSAFVVHLVLSLLIFSTLIFTMYYFWFPRDLFFLDGGYQGLKIVAMVDLVLGPLLTLLVFKPGKKSLKFDMATIASIQLVALAYGFYTTYHQQTIAVVFAEKTFNTLSRAAHVSADRQLKDLELQPNSLEKFGSAYPYTIYTVQPTGGSMGRYIADLLNDYPEAHERSDKYLDIAGNYEQMRADRLQREQLEQDGSWQQVEHALNKGKLSLQDYDLYKFKARYGSGVAVFDPESFRIVDYIKIETGDQEQSTTESASLDLMSIDPTAVDHAAAN